VIADERVTPPMNASHTARAGGIMRAIAGCDGLRDCSPEVACVDNCAASEDFAKCGDLLFAEYTLQMQHHARTSLLISSPAHEMRQPAKRPPHCISRRTTPCGVWHTPQPLQSGIDLAAFSQ